MKALCFDRWYCSKALAQGVAKGLEAKGCAYIIGLVESPEGAWGILYIIGDEFCANWHILTITASVITDILHERKGAESYWSSG